jgi:hypothetical protein
MRLAIVLSLLLALTGEARANVFVPADPPPLPEVGCSSSAGDLVVAGSKNELFASVAGGPWAPVAGFDGCAVVATAADGTAAIVGGGVAPGETAMIVRRPGQTFGAPLAVGAIAETPAVAVAPGGWAAVVWETDSDDVLMAMIVRPDGSSTRSVVARPRKSRSSPESFGPAKVAIDASGNATVVWPHYAGSKLRFRTARSAAGGPAQASSDLIGVPIRADAFDIAYAGGHALLTWATEAGLQTLFDGHPVQTVDPTTVVAGLATSLADDGSAVIAYASDDREMIAVDRAAGGGWTSPHVLAVAPKRLGGDYTPDADDTPAPLTLVVPGGRAAVAWGARRDGLLGVSATSGQAGGAWAPPTALSSMARDAFPTGFALTAAGVPRVLWIEIGRGSGLYGATLAPAKLDTTPPVVSARLPKRVAPTRTGRLAVRVRVRCSEACDARLSAAVGEVSSERDVRAIAPGHVATLRLPTSSELEHELRFNPRSRRVRLELLVSDRAGNLVRRRQTVRVKVIEPPLLSLKVAPDHDFGMASPAGDRAVALLVNDLIVRAAARQDGDPMALQRRFHRGVVAIRRAGHREINRSKVRQEIYRVLELPLSRALYDVDRVLSD